MANSSDKNKDRSSNLGTHTQGINPSAPSVGTAGWGTTADEKKGISAPDAESTRAGQMKGNLGDNMTEASQRASEAATTNKRPASNKDRDMDQADLSRRTSGSAHSMNTSHGGQDYTFRCADAGNADCRWETSGSTEDEVMHNVREHARREHGMSDWTEAMNNRMHDAIHRRKAA